MQNHYTDYIDNDALLVIGNRLLDKIVEVFAEEQAPLPARRYVTLGGQGETVHDADQVTVSWEQTYSGAPGEQSLSPVRRQMGRSAVFVCEIVRTIPGLTAKGGPPSVEAITAATNVQLKDAQLLFEAGLRAGELGSTEKCIIDVSAGKPQGLKQAILMNFIAAI